MPSKRVRRMRRIAKLAGNVIEFSLNLWDQWQIGRRGCGRMAYARRNRTDILHTSRRDSRFRMSGRKDAPSRPKTVIPAGVSGDPSEENSRWIPNDGCRE